MMYVDWQIGQAYFGRSIALIWHQTQLCLMYSPLRFNVYNFNIAIQMYMNLSLKDNLYGKHKQGYLISFNEATSHNKDTRNCPHSRRDSWGIIPI